MHLKITSPEQTIYDAQIEQATIPTQMGEITILPGHFPLASVLKPWLIKISPMDRDDRTFLEGTDFIFEDDKITLTVSRWLVFVDGEKIKIVTSSATVRPDETDEILEKMKTDLEKEIAQITLNWSIDDLETLNTSLQKVSADIKLSKLRK